MYGNTHINIISFINLLIFIRISSLITNLFNFHQLTHKGSLYQLAWTITKLLNVPNSEQKKDYQF